MDILQVEGLGVIAIGSNPSRMAIDPATLSEECMWARRQKSASWRTKAERVRTARLGRP
ncbi:hypothetical protein CRG98_023179 [Punica granatum]|uniref:Uncharacterized protein n=1 Tax=Punica granatum TaxID=22663 RepID=A0A2I0JJJ1_PUNGR|nr:hypothetical protein CRG98_023179 [Punica granatum]